MAIGSRASGRPLTMESTASGFGAESAPSQSRPLLAAGRISLTPPRHRFFQTEAEREAEYESKREDREAEAEGERIREKEKK